MTTNSLPYNKEILIRIPLFQVPKTPSSHCWHIFHLDHYIPLANQRWQHPVWDLNPGPFSPEPSAVKTQPRRFGWSKRLFYPFLSWHWNSDLKWTIWKEIKALGIQGTNEPAKKIVYFHHFSCTPVFLYLSYALRTQCDPFSQVLYLHQFSVFFLNAQQN